MPRDTTRDAHPADTAYGADAPNLSLELTRDDIDDIALTPHIPAPHRRLQLIAIRNDLQALAIDNGDRDLGALLNHVEDRIRDLENQI